jgi:hypothetical protein
VLGEDIASATKKPGMAHASTLLHPICREGRYAVGVPLRSSRTLTLVDTRSLITSARCQEER